MQLPVKAHYAAVAMLAMAHNHRSGQLLTVRAIADEHAIPAQFLVQILQQLRAAGLISSIRGSCGGFRLERSPSQISVAEIVDAVCPPSVAPPSEASSPLNAIVREVWQELSELESRHLGHLKLSDLCDRMAETSQAMFYI